MAKTATMIVSHQSAARFYLTSSQDDPRFPRPCNDRPLQRASSTGQIPDCLPLGLLGPTIDFLVKDPNLRRRSNGRAAHSCTGDVPRGAFWKFGDHAYIVSPELCFVQMAQVLSGPQLVELGINLCAKYFRNPQTGKSDNRKPITTVENIAQGITNLTDIPGSGKAARALRWVADNSNSPMETKLYILLSYPVRRGGYGIDGLVMNHQVKPSRSKKLTEQGHFSIDICMPGRKAGAEYYGKDFHEDVVHDRRRLDGLDALGWHMVVIDKWRLYNIDAFEVAARQFAHHLGKRIRRNEDAWRVAALALRKELRLQ